MPQHPDSGDLDGMQVVLLRAPERCAGMAAELERRGAAPLVLQLIDFEEPEDPAPLEAALGSLSAGGYAWLIVTSVTTVASLKLAASRRGHPLSAAVGAGVSVAAVGDATRRALAGEGIPVALVPPGEESSLGLISAMPDGPGAVLLPQAAIADDVLADGLAAKGLQVSRVDAYRTVDYPADPSRRLPSRPAPAGLRLIDTARFRDLAAQGSVDAVVLTSPSTVRRFCAVLPDAAGFHVVAIGSRTAAEAAGMGLVVGATAAAPTPRGVADAVRAAADPTRPPSPNGVPQ